MRRNSNESRKLLEKLHAEMLAHIQKEEQVLFPFIAQMDQDSIVTYPPAHACFRSVSFPIFMMEQEHESANHIMGELRNLTRGFEPPEWGCITHIALFAGIREFESDSSCMCISKTTFSSRAPSRWKPN